MASVLIVDDAAFMRMSLKMMLEKNGYQVVGEAVNGVEGIRMFNELRPDIVTMDITMPEMTGLEALKGIMAIDKKAKVMMVSAMGQETMVKEAVVAGARGFVVKPFTEDVVVKALRQLGG
ncbi:MAG TPA: response regulator [Patescibacteria group bacterium]|nr:response regulator [Patescibacteria group bacterium]